MKSCFGLLFLVLAFTYCSDADNKEDKVIEKTDVVKGLDEQVKKNPDSAVLRMRLINSLDSLKLYNEAIAHADSLIKRDSLNQALWVTKAHLQESNKDTINAIKSYERALNIYPSIEAQLYLANLFAETKDQRALLVTNNVRRMSLGREADANCNFIDGVYYARTGNNTKALQSFDKAIIDNYTLMEAYMEKGFIHYDSKKYNESLKVFEKAITVNNTYADAYYWKAKCLEALGNKLEAITNYQRSLALDKELREAKDAIKRLE